MSCSRFVRTKRRAPIAWESSMFPIPKRTRHGIPCSHRKIVVKANSSQTESVGPMSEPPRFHFDRSPVSHDKRRVELNRTHARFLPIGQKPNRGIPIIRTRTITLLTICFDFSSYSKKNRRNLSCQFFSEKMKFSFVANKYKLFSFYSLFSLFFDYFYSSVRYSIH